jgi:hypothetical protein
MYNIPISREQVEEQLSQYQKINYNQFRWWRTHQPKSKPLHHYQPLRDRILNGDFDPSCYKPQAYMCEYQLIDLLEECNNDYQKFLERGSVMLARRKRLWEDFEKDETERLDSLIKQFTIYFRCSKKQVIEEIDKCGGELIDLYYIIEEKYSTYSIPQTKRRGRPRKIV